MPPLGVMVAPPFDKPQVAGVVVDVTVGLFGLLETVKEDTAVQPPPPAAVETVTV